MKKVLCIVLLLQVGLCLFTITAVAVDSGNFDNLGQDIIYDLKKTIDDDTLGILENIGLKDFGFEEIYNISFENITSFFKNTLKDKISVISKAFSELFSVVILAGLVAVVFKEYSDENFTNILCVVIISIMTVNVIEDSLGAVVSVLEISGKFMLCFAPIYTLIISVSGNTATALTYNTFALAIAEIVSTVISSGLTDLIGAFFCLGISFSLNESVNVRRFTGIVNRVYSTVLGLTASIFTGFLSLKNILSVSVDRVSIKSIRYLIGSLIPVVGSSISEAYSSLLGSINLIKSSVAIVGILVIIIVNTPIIVETLAYYLMFNLLEYLSESLQISSVADIFRIFSSGMRILLLLCIFEMFIMIITTGIVLSVKGGG